MKLYEVDVEIEVLVAASWAIDVMTLRVNY